MTLDDLKALERAAEALERKAQTAEGAMKEIASVRQSDLPFRAALDDLLRYGSIEKARALDQALKIVRDDVFRLAEMSLEAQAREHRSLARLKRESIARYCYEAIEQEPKT
ncbi:MAG: hypothetical protein AB1830_12930 [Pseudomonadota bacterium]